MVDPMYSTDDSVGESSEPGEFERGQEPADREPRPGNAPAPGQRPSESGSTPPDIPTRANEDAQKKDAIRRRPVSEG